MKILIILLLLINYKCILCDLTVFSIGDWGKKTNCLYAITEKMSSLCEKMKPRFIVSVGDNFYPNGVNSINDNKWHDIFEKTFYKLKDIEIHSCLGDHDWRGSTISQIDRTNMTNNTNWYLPGYWWFEKITFNSSGNISSLFESSALDSSFQNFIYSYNNTKFNATQECGETCLDELIDTLDTTININNPLDNDLTYMASISEYGIQDDRNASAIFIYLDSWMMAQDPFKKTSLSHRDLQLEFLENTLKAAITDDVDWIIIITHYSIYSSGHHGPHKRISEYLLPLIEKYKVDFFISGHDHHSEYLFPINLNTHFHIVGAASRPRSGFGKEHEYSIFKTNNCSFTSFTFSKDISIARIFELEKPVSTSFKRSNRIERSKMKIQHTVYPDSVSTIRVNTLFNIVGFTLSLSLYS